MNITDLRNAQTKFQNKINNITNDRRELYKLRESFVKHFSKRFISEMKLEDYASGLRHINGNTIYNFCYSLEWDLDRLGTIKGSPSKKFGIYYSPDKQGYVFASSKFGKTKTIAFCNIKKSIIELIEAGKNNNMDLIETNLLSHTFKGKILSTYFPDKYLGVFSNEHLDYFLAFYDLDNDSILNKDAIYKREELVAYKNKDKIMCDWSLDMFTRFLYDEYPGRPPKESDNSDNNRGENIIFPKKQNVQFINLEQTNLDKHNNSNKSSSKAKKPNYELESRRKRKLGDRGEKLVMDIEYKRLCDLGLKHLAKGVKWVSRDSDSYGYDILSYNEDGSERYIEVKATRGSVGKTNFFISSNEMEVAKEYGDNYYIYIVYNIESTTPKVWMSNSIFSDENEAKVEKKPISYKITINTKKK